MIWCVEDDASIRDIEVYDLQSTGFEAKGFEDGTSFWEALRTGRPELVVLDVMLPGIDGMELLRRMRADAALSDIPVVMATAKGAEYDKIRGLDLGADYYLTKPFGVMELVSCVKAVLRRCGTKTAAQLRCDGLVLDEESHTVTADEESVALTYKEFELLRLFLSHPGTAFSRDQLMADVWGTDYCGETRWTCTSARCGRSSARTARRSRPCAAWATGWRARHDKKDLSLHPACGGHGAAGEPARHHGLPVRILRERRKKAAA